jgi:hypothetical protein
MRARALLMDAGMASERTPRSFVLHCSNALCGGVFTDVVRKLRCCSPILATLFLCGNAAADEGRALHTHEDSSFVLDLRTFAGIATHRLSATDEATSRSKEVVDFDALAWGAAARVGFDASAHVRLGATASVEQYWRTGELAVRDAEALGDRFFQFDDTPRLWSPLGLFAELHPWADLGAFVGLSLALGYVPAVEHPRPGTIDADQYLAGYALEAGYGSLRSSSFPFGVFLRYSAWSGSESPLHTDYPEGQSLGEWTLGGRWAFCP